MQESILSLMQMPRTTILIQRLRERKLPYIVVLTNPTTGGVTASYAMLGDVHMAEPGALIGFAGPRVTGQMIREHLPDGFQRAEFLKEHGMVDMVVHRHHLHSTLARLYSLLMRLPAMGPGRRPMPRRMTGRIIMKLTVRRLPLNRATFCRERGHCLAHPSAPSPFWLKDDGVAATMVNGRKTGWRGNGAKPGSR